MSSTALFREHDPHWADLGWLAAATFAAAVIGGLASVDAPSFYAGLAKPSWAPPAGVFGPVWTLLYVSMCVAAWLVVRAQGRAEARPALQLYGVQLVANAGWSWLFFHVHSGALAFFGALLLLVLVALTAHAFWRRRRPAGLLMLPYLAWVTFASALAFEVWQLNPGGL